MILYLNDKKVAKHFGAYPERGRFIPSTVKRVTVGVRWNLPKGCHEPDDDVLVRPVMALKCLGRGKWKLSVEPQFHEKAVSFLCDNCM